MNPALSVDALAPAGATLTEEAFGEPGELLTGDALALAPEVTGDDAVADPDPLNEDALPVVVPEDARTQLERLLRGARLDAVFQAANQFNADVSDGRSIDPLTLGLLWLSEGGARLTITLDPNGAVFAVNHTSQILDAMAVSGSSERSRTWRITNVGLWGFGLDDIFTLSGGTVSDLDRAAAEARWAARLRQHGDWSAAVPFAGANPTSVPPVVTALTAVDLSLTSAEAVGFLIAVAARFTKQLWALPQELALRGITLDTNETEKIPLIEPVLAYMCYLQRAPKAAALWEALIFLIEFAASVTLATPMSTSPGHYDLFFVIDVLNRWLPQLRDTSELGLPAILRGLVVDATASAPDGRLGRDVLADIAARSDWNPMPAQASLDSDGLLLLAELVESWRVFATRMGNLPPQVSPGDLFFLGADSSVSPMLFPSQLGTTGFGARNYGQRFQSATRLPLGGRYRRVETGLP